MVVLKVAENTVRKSKFRIGNICFMYLFTSTAVVSADFTVKALQQAKLICSNFHSYMLCKVLHRIVFIIQSVLNQFELKEKNDLTFFS